MAGQFFFGAVLAFSLLFALCKGHIHHLVIHSDSRPFFPISTFGFNQHGHLKVNMSHFHVLNSPTKSVKNSSLKKNLTLGFTIDKTTNSAMNPYATTSESRCILGPERLLPIEPAEDAIIRFVMDLENNQTRVECSKNLENIIILTGKDQDDVLETLLDTPSAVTQANVTACGKELKLAMDRHSTKEGILFNTSFILYVADQSQEGLYSLYFHNCPNYERSYHSQDDWQRNSAKHGYEDKVHVSFIIGIVEKNENSFLSAGEMPLPQLYTFMSVMFFFSGLFWVFILRKNGTEQVFRIHWIMAALVFLKALSLFFHGVNYHKMQTYGYHIKSWAILYYVTHLLKGGLLFFTIVLIGSGWAFIKCILSDKEKRVFMIVLPLQVIANVAYIIIEESEEGEARHSRWMDIFILVDLLCCGAILLPVVWSIRHLQESSGTDGKASISLEKLKLFRHFYIMVVSYVYFTRIVVYLLRITVPFQYEWMDEMFKEITTFVFFVTTGYKFRPASNNPYFSVPTDDYDMGEVLIGGTALQEQVTNRKSKRVFVDDDDEEDSDGEDSETLMFLQSQAIAKNNTESSHDLD